ncbi:MAG: PD40 domain-containing protein [candidate division Zixibacteria bacterium]|nr:PD40 domain-containing protein [candidate division Zixibacteria bacterium]
MVVKSLRNVLFLLMLSGIVPAVFGQALYLRQPAPSPDGRFICFGFQGDLWIVSSQGGRAERLTVHVGYDGHPSWSPDGRFIAFSSDRNGNFDVFVIPAAGGSELQLTSHTADDIVTGWSSDSRRVLFHGSRDYDFDQVWEVPAAGGREKPLTSIEANYGRRSDHDAKLLFTRGWTPWWQKGYRGSAGCDLYLKDMQSGSIERLTSFSGNDLNGFLVPSGAELIYLSDSTGNYNLFRKNLVGGTVVQLTNHRLDVFQPSLSADGTLIAYEMGGEIYLYDLRTNQGRKLQVDVPSIAKINDGIRAELDSGITDLAVAPDGRQLAAAVAGEVYCLDLSSGQQRRLTISAVAEHGLGWSADAAQLAFITREQDASVLTLISSNETTEPLLALAHDFHVKQLLKSERLLSQPTFSPDQTRVAFVRGGTQLVVADIKKLTERLLADKAPIGEYAWSPDGRYLIFTQLNGDWLNELFIGDSESGSVERVSPMPGHYFAPRFSADGRLIYFIADGDLHYAYLDRALAEQPSYRRRELVLNQTSQNAGAAPLKIDFEGINHRVIRATAAANIHEVWLAPASDDFVILTQDGEIDLLGIETTAPRHLATLPQRAEMLRLAPNDHLAYAIDPAGRLFSIDLVTGDLESIPFSVELTARRSELLRQMFDDCWLAVRERFYDAGLHDVNWSTVRESFAPRLQHLTEIRDLHDLIHEMFGQLKSSHLDLWLPETDHAETGMLGLLPDYQDNSAGLIALEIPDDSPAATARSQIRQYDKITAVENLKLAGEFDPFRPFLGTVGREVRIDLINRTGITRSVNLVPLSVPAHRHVIAGYQTALARARVEDASKGNIGYVRVVQMTAAALELFQEDLRRYAVGKEALIVDLRGNSGGSEHDRFLQLLARKKYITHKPRVGMAGADAPLAIAGPVVLLVDERTSSDAEILAQGFRELGAGEIIGVTTHGAVIGTEKQRLLDGSTLSIPTVGWFTLAGQNLENHGVSPDVAVPLDLTRADKGEDNQLQQAIERLLQKLQ